MSFAREGFFYMAVAALIAAGTYALALNRRSWSLWLLAFVFTIAALWVAYLVRDPARHEPPGERVAEAPMGGRTSSTRRPRRTVTSIKESTQVRSHHRATASRLAASVGVAHTELVAR